MSPYRGGLSPASAAWRGTGPRPTVKRAVLDTVAWGPVPRDLSINAARGPIPRAFFRPGP